MAPEVDIFRFLFSSRTKQRQQQLTRRYMAEARGDSQLNPRPPRPCRRSLAGWKKRNRILILYADKPRNYTLLKLPRTTRLFLVRFLLRMRAQISERKYSTRLSNFTYRVFRVRSTGYLEEKETREAARECVL